MKMKTMMAVVLLSGIFGAATASGPSHELTMLQIPSLVQNAKTLTTAQINAILTRTITDSDVTRFIQENKTYRVIGNYNKIHSYSRLSVQNVNASLSERLFGYQFKLVRDLSQDQINAISQETVNMIGSRLQAELKRRGRKIG